MSNYPLTSETMYGATPNGGTTICNDCGVPVGYDGLVPPVLCYRCSQTESASKVETLAENLKHLDKPGASDTPHYWWMATSRGVAFTGRGRFWGTKVNGGRNKPRGALAMDKASTEFRPVSANSARLSPSALVRWFPVALENTTYSDAIARHSTWMGQEGLRVTPGFVFGHRLSSKYDGRRYFDKEWAPNELWGNKAQVNRYHALKTY